MRRHSDRTAALQRAILDTPGATDRSKRLAAEAGQPTGTPADAYLAKVRSESYRIVDADVDALRSAGMPEDAIFELTLAAALGEATRRFDHALSITLESTSGERA
jgi:alkylhydroperoxidase family enzyme